ncbi:G-type lectin S-receptor-like serine/threonine-protein kinase [Dichanthelium oligosanthes]|uniref:non-specific serine/threonine protein kinase n=1 Tax=Dichanthelium oligosanthes TaxID=888268 RepID=A0A1E5VK38_9POAL|nr:G-type lectin S-receptor-like serine/threonine-protein kinase [Dichanthelium oligosanthes]
MDATMCSHLIILSFMLLSPIAFAPGAGVADTLGKGRNITDSETLVSANGTFTLGFFSPGVSTKRYLGIWFSVSSDAVCWVANGDRPVNGNSGALVVSSTGSLLLLDGAGQISWSTNSSGASSAEAQLLDNGNLVVRDRGSSTILWQSFDHPSNTLLSGMKLGKNMWTGAEWYLTAWSSADDPSPGAYRRVLDTSGLPELIVWHGNVRTYSAGPWNGRWFSGVPEATGYMDLVTFQVTTSPEERSYGYTAKPGAPLTRVVVTDTGMVKRLFWDAGTRTWRTFFQGPRDVCDAYGKCGAFGLCDAGAAASSFCSCLRGFSPASPSAWSLRDTSGGCRRNVKLDCANGTTTDGFLLVRGVKLPDTHNATVNMSTTVEDCMARCLASCSCLAYAAADIRGGDVRSGCVMYTDDIIDLRYVDQGQDLYLRLAKSELPPPPAPSPRRPFPTVPVVGACAAAVAVGTLPNGTKVAVKKLTQSSATNEGSEVFMREVEVMSKIRHENLARLLAYCKDGNERILVYEGYTAPEYAAQGRLLTLKCDVYSFGVVLLEIISGKRNNDNPTLISDARECWNQHRIKEDLLDAAVAQPEPEILLELERCVQIALLCVQQSPADRPSMAEVVTMLTNSSSSQTRSSNRPVFDSMAASPLREANLSTQDASGAHEDSIYLT